MNSYQSKTVISLNRRTVVQVFIGFIVAWVSVVGYLVTTPKMASPEVSQEAAPGSKPSADPKDKVVSALKLITFKWETTLPGWKVVGHPYRKNMLALTLVADKEIRIYVRPERSTQGIAHDIGHEIGHALDVTYNTPASRAAYLKLRNKSELTAWWVKNQADDRNSPVGDFAEMVAWDLVPRYKFYSTFASKPTANDEKYIAAWLASIEFPSNSPETPPITTPLRKPLEVK